MARLSLIGAILAGLVGLGACRTEPRVRPQPLYLTVTDFCISSLGRGLVTSAPGTVSADLIIVDADTLAPGRTDVVGRSSCETFEVTADVAELQLGAVAAVLDLLDALPALRASGRYGLVGGLYFDEPACAEGDRAPVACGMSAAFGGDEPAASPSDAGADGGEPRLEYFVMCPSVHEPCLRDAECDVGVCLAGEGTCARDEQCRGGTCGDDGACRDGVCQGADGECLALACSTAASCEGADCVTPSGAPCLPGTCQDFVPDQQLAPMYQIGHPFCSALYRDATAAD